MVDYRATNTSLDSSSINGRMIDRSIELIGMLNKVIGADGLGTKNFTISGELGNIEETLAVHTIERNINDPKWTESQLVYFGTTNSRLDLIQTKLSENLEKIKNDIAGNVSGLFEILNSKNGLFDSYEQALKEARTAKEIERAEEELQAEMTRILTSDEVLNEMIEAFFANIELTVERMNDEIFDLLNDYDGIYSNGTTDKAAQKYFVTLPNRPGESGTRASLIIDNIDDLLELVLKENKEIYETQNGTGSYGTSQEMGFLASQVLGSFAIGKLTLSEEMINAIIVDQGLNDKNLESIDSMKTFLKLIDQNKLLQLAREVYGTGNNDEATFKALLKDHLHISTPKYYEDQRSLFDILKGKASADSFDNESTVFNSIGNQIKKVSDSAIDLLGHGYEKVTKSNLHETIRRSPISAIDYLEAKKLTLNEDEKKEIQKLLDKFIDKQGQAIEFMIKQEGKRTVYNEALVNKLKNLLALIDSYNGDSSEIKNLINSDPELKELFGEIPEISSEIEINTFQGVMEELIVLPNIHAALYGNELREANQINAQYEARKLPEHKQDGTLPEDTSIAPPTIGPSPLAGVLARIGDILLQKAHNLEKDSNIPTEAWMDENVSMLKTINEQLPSLGASSAGEAFITSLRENFKNVIKEFFTANQPIKEIKDKARDNFRKTNEIGNEIEFLISKGLIDPDTGIEDLKNLERNLGRVNYRREIRNRTNFISDLNDQIQNLNENLENPDLEDEEKEEIHERIEELNNQISSLGSEILGLTTDSENLDAIRKVLELEDEITEDKVISGFHSLLEKKGEKYKQSIIDFSDSMTNFRRDADNDGEADIVQIFKNSLDKASLDLDGNGQNDFVDITGIIDRVGDLSSKIKNIYGGNQAVAGGMEEQSIRRLILLMFVFSMLEAGEWDYRRYEADTTRYQS